MWEVSLVKTLAWREGVGRAGGEFWEGMEWG